MVKYISPTMLCRALRTWRIMFEHNSSAETQEHVVSEYTYNINMLKGSWLKGTVLIL